MVIYIACGWRISLFLCQQRTISTRMKDTAVSEEKIVHQLDMREHNSARGEGQPFFLHLGTLIGQVFSSYARNFEELTLELNNLI